MPKYIKWVDYKAEQQPWLNELMSGLNMETFLFLAQGKTMSLSSLVSMHPHTTQLFLIWALWTFSLEPHFSFWRLLPRLNLSFFLQINSDFFSSSETIPFALFEMQQNNWDYTTNLILTAVLWNCKQWRALCWSPEIYFRLEVQKVLTMKRALKELRQKKKSTFFFAECVSLIAREEKKEKKKKIQARKFSTFKK